MNLYTMLTEPYEAFTGAWHTEEGATAVHAVAALKRERVPRLRQTFCQRSAFAKVRWQPGQEGEILEEDTEQGVG